MGSKLTFGKWLRKRRRALDFTQKELAQQVGCAVSTIRKFEADERRPSKALATRLADCLNIAPMEVDRFITFARSKPYLDAATSPPMDSAPTTFRPVLRPLSPLTSFVGREQELARITRLLLDEPDCRLLTLSGPGGVGKTRLALKISEQLPDRFADGVYFVSLVGVSGPEFLAPAIIDALHFSFSGGTDPKVQMLNHLRKKEMLLVLDNFEHLINPFSIPPEMIKATNLLLEILMATAGVKLLITSRERLNLQAEWLISLQGLSYPAGEPAPNEVRYEAMELFRQRARHTQSNFDLTTEWSNVARICQLVAGLPLAIELAAAWVYQISCDEIAGELAKNLDLLTTSWPDLPVRHRSLKSVFEHSWQLLSAEEKAVMRSLSVFQGGFDRQAARAVARANLAHLSALVDKCMLHRTQTGRYELHELLRQFTTEKLHKSSVKIEQIRQRHCDYYIAFLHRLGNDLKGEKHRVSIEKIA